MPFFNFTIGLTTTLLLFYLGIFSLDYYFKILFELFNIILFFFHFMYNWNLSILILQKPAPYWTHSTLSLKIKGLKETPDSILDSHSRPQGNNFKRDHPSSSILPYTQSRCNKYMSEGNKIENKENT